MALNDYELQFGGLLLGGDTDYGFVAVDGLADHPDVRSSDQTRLRRHGLLPGDDFLGGRRVVVQLEVNGDTVTTFQTAVDALKAALEPGQDETPLRFQIPGIAGGGTRRLLCRPRKLALPVDRDRFYHRLPVAAVELFATTPLIVDDVEQSQAVGLASSVAGLSWNLSWNLNWGGSSTSSTVTATNTGTFPTPMVVRFDGPVTNPRVENLDTGEHLDFSADSGIVATSGEYLEVDTEARTVLLNGTASRYSKLSSDSAWFDLAPGDNHLRFQGSTTGAPTMTVTWRSAWL